MNTVSGDTLNQNAKRIQRDLADVIQEALNDDAETAEVLLASMCLVANVAMLCRGEGDTAEYVAKETAKIVRKLILKFARSEET